ncbi:MAG: ATP-binding protein [Candidatus Aminicenantes bacterium]|nr:MAG: ATP-binding protein [Candidatus Aminicenantes bacterium]
MIVDFTVKNFRSIKEQQTFSMLASTIKDELPGNVFQTGGEKKLTLLKTSVIYGPNASGKSNLIMALKFLASFVVHSTDLKVEQDIPYYDPYKFDKSNLSGTTELEIEFIGNDKIRYRYMISFNRKEIQREELVFYPKKQESCLFLRERGKPIKFGSQLIGKKKSIESELLPNQLFLSKAANSNHLQLKDIYLYFLKNLQFHMADDSRAGKKLPSTLQLVEQNTQLKKKLIDFLVAVDTGIHSIGVRKKEDGFADRNKYPGRIAQSPGMTTFTTSSFTPVIYHKVYDKDREIGAAALDLDEESNGTIKMYHLAVKIIEVLEEGHTLIIDELDTSIHPLVSEYILELFNDPGKNPNNGQLIAAAHDVSLLDSRMLRRDQIWFTAKNSYGATEVFSLDEFDKNEVRKNTAFDKWYLHGRFGALPMINKKQFSINKKRK